MSRRSPTAQGIARLRGSFAALLLLSVVLQIGLFVGEQALEDAAELSRTVPSVAAVQRAETLERLRLALPVALLLLTLGLGAFVFRRLIRPFEGSLKDLSRSERDLRATRDELELRVEQRTAELVLANEELRRQTELLDSIQQQMGDAVLVSDENARIILWNPVASSLLDFGEGGIGADWGEKHPCFLPGQTTPLDVADMPIMHALRGEPTEQVELLMKSPARPDGIWLSVTGRPLHAQDRSIRGSILVIRDITARKQAEEALRRSNDELEERVRERARELRDAQQQALALARQAGMAELATNILHNVGNVLNSVNTSTAMLGEGLRGLRIEPVARTADLLEQRGADLAAFLSSDKQGRRVSELLRKLGEHLAGQRDEMLSMTEELQRHVDHIRTIVEMQQSYAMGAVMIEETSLADLVEDALRIHAAALARHRVTVERQLPALPPVLVDKHRVLQILLNLMSNAKYALDKVSPEARRLTLRIERAPGDQIRLQVIDSGEGIEPALLTRIFQHGFSNRTGGHGFGLHSCSMAARALGGSLSAHSEGPGKGATFTLEIPFKPVSVGAA